MDGAEDGTAEMLSLLVLLSMVIVGCVLTDGIGFLSGGLSAAFSSVVGSGGAGQSSVTKACPAFAVNPDMYTTLPQVTQALRTAGLEASELVIGVDFTKSNEWQGSRTFGGKSLHTIEPGVPNPYEEVIAVIAATLADFDADNLVPVYAFGDDQSRDRHVTPLHGKELCKGVDAVLEAYRSAAQRLQLSGPTSFAPIIRQACRIAGQEGHFHILIIIADGAVTAERETAAAIVEACAYPLAIIMVGVGDGPWDTMQKFDDELPERRWDNFQFVQYADVIQGRKHPRSAFAVAALQEVPAQFLTIKRLGLLGQPSPQDSAMPMSGEGNGAE